MNGTYTLLHTQVPPGLLQLCAVRHNRHPAPASPVDAECGGEAGNWHTTQRAHHAGVEVTPLVTNLPAYYVQGRRHCPQMSKRPCSSVPVQLVSVGPAYALPARPYWKFRGRELQSATGRFLSLDHESGTVYLLPFTVLTHLRASGNC